MGQILGTPVAAAAAPADDIPLDTAFDNLPIELQENIRHFAPSYIFPVDIQKLNALGNCGAFLQNLEPVRADQIDAQPLLREAFHEVVLRSLVGFHKRVNKLRLYRKARIRYPYKDMLDPEFNHNPLIERIRLAIEDVSAHPDMPAADLMERCKRISEWKNELRQMPEKFSMILDAYRMALMDPGIALPVAPGNPGGAPDAPMYGPLGPDVWEGGDVKLYNFRYDQQTWEANGVWFGPYLVSPASRRTYAQVLITALARDMERDNPMLPEVLKPL
jgi:hypothetical protein